MLKKFQPKVMGRIAVLGMAIVGLLADRAYGVQASDPGKVAATHIERFLEPEKDAGLAAAVWADGKVAWSREWGLSNKEERVAVDADTMFRIGSVAKVVTAAALCSMAEDGKLDLDRTLGEFLPNAPRHLHAITPRQLAGHLSGIRHYDSARMQQEFLSRVHYENHLAAMKIFQDDPLKSAPGESYLYTTYGFTALGAIMESAEQKKFIEILREHVLEPAEMDHTFAEHNETVRGTIAIPYGAVQGRKMTFPPVNNSNKLAGGGLVSTATDLTRFMGALVNQQIMSSESFEMMMQSQKTSSGKTTSVGLGWRVGKDSNGRRFLHHGGAAAGGRTFVLLYPDQKIGVALCMNLASHEFKFDKKLALQVLLPFVDRAVDN